MQNSPQILNKQGTDNKEAAQEQIAGAYVLQNTNQNHIIEDETTNMSARIVIEGKTARDKQMIKTTFQGDKIVKLGPVQMQEYGLYDGQWRNGMREGTGIHYFPDGSIYTGQWKANHQHGKGKVQQSNGDRFEGQWREGKLDGYASFYQKNLDCTVSGIWRQGKLNGKGVLIAPGNYTYEGEWLDSEKHGIGKTTWASGKIYEGQYVKDKRCGYGNLLQPNGQRYVGGWKDNKQHGQGYRILKCGLKKHGEWMEGTLVRWMEESYDEQRHACMVKEVKRIQELIKKEFEALGQKWKIDINIKPECELAAASHNVVNTGRTQKDDLMIQSTFQGNTVVKLGPVEFSNRCSYEGEWKNGLKQGIGLQMWPDGSYNLGQWKANLPFGIGMIVLPDGDTYQGERINGKAHGRGILDKGNRKYTGFWKEDEMQGFRSQIWNGEQTYVGYYNNKYKSKGLLTYPDGSYYDGSFLNERFHGKGTYYWATVDRTYEGDWLNSMMHGYGKTTWSDGRFYEGQYVNDNKQGFGTFYWPDGRRYTGSWKDGKQHGRGYYIFPSGRRRYGQWVEGTKKKWIDEPEYH